MITVHYMQYIYILIHAFTFLISHLPCGSTEISRAMNSSGLASKICRPERHLN